MKKERIFALTILGLIMISFLASFVLAQDGTEAAEATKGALTGVGGFLNTLLGPLFGNKELLSRVFLYVLLYMILYSIVSMVFKGKRLMNIIITVVITALAVLWLPSNFITTIRDQYGAMGAAILSVIPFAIMLVFTLKIGSLLAARVLWIFYLIYYFALYIYRITSSSAGWLSAETIPYFFAIIAGIIIFFFIGAIRKAIFKGEMGAIQEEGAKVAIRGRLLHKLQKEELEESYGAGGG